MQNPVPVLPDKVYDRLKWIAQIVLPALATLYLALGLPHGKEVSGAMIAIDAFLGTILGLSSKAYNDSDAKYDGSVEKKTLDVDLEKQVDLDKSVDVLLKVEDPVKKTTPRKRPAKKTTPKKTVDPQGQ